MDPTLKKEAEKIKKLAEEREMGFALKKTFFEHIIVIACDGRAAMLMKSDHEAYGEMIGHFKINLKKWEWAEAEGFCEEDSFSEVIHEVIEAVSYPVLLDYLIYDR
tara:strand:+ start:94 stop:411 length:318 start_codon:yes stop_codon:yes gene_type:complete